MDTFRLFEIESARNDQLIPRVPCVAVEITRGCRLTLEWDEMFARYVISFSKYKLEELLRFAAKVNIMHIERLQDGLDTLVKYIEDNDLNQHMKKE